MTIQKLMAFTLYLIMIPHFIIAQKSKDPKDIVIEGLKPTDFRNMVSGGIIKVFFGTNSIAKNKNLILEEGDTILMNVIITDGFDEQYNSNKLFDNGLVKIVVGDTKYFNDYGETLNNKYEGDSIIKMFKKPDFYNFGKHYPSSNTGFLVQYMKITKVLKQKPIELSQNNVENQKIIEDYLKDKKFRNIVISEYYNSIYESNISIKAVEYVGDLKSGFGIIRDIDTRGEILYVCGQFKNGLLNGYGKVVLNRKTMLGNIRKVLEGNFQNNLLHGNAEAHNYENLNNLNKVGCFFNGEFITNNNFGGIDSNGSLFIKVNNGNCLFYPNFSNLNNIKTSNVLENFYGIDQALSDGIFGDEETEEIKWDGRCVDGLANGKGSINIKGVTRGFYNEKKLYSRKIFFGSFKNGKYDNCKVYNFNDFATMLVTGEDAIKWSVYENGNYIGEDLSDVKKVQEQYSSSLHKLNSDKISSNSYSKSNTNSINKESKPRSVSNQNNDVEIKIDRSGKKCCFALEESYCFDLYVNGKLKASDKTISKSKLGYWHSGCAGLTSDEFTKKDIDYRDALTIWYEKYYSKQHGTIKVETK